MKGRDRTAEFIATVNSRRERPQWIKNSKNVPTTQKAPNKLAIDPQYREMMRTSMQCAHRIRNSFENLEKFTVLARKRTIFDDGELNRLIAEIRRDISETKSQLDQLQATKSEIKQRHTENIVTILQRKLANVTSDFKSTLEMRSRSVQQQSARHELYAGPATPSSSTMNSSVILDINNSNQALIPSTSRPYEEQPQLQQQLFMHHDQFETDRADKMQMIESTIVELGAVFNQLAHIVQDQGESITRIDMKISETTANVEAAHDALLRYFSSINNNRWLILKVFGVLFFFFVVFVMFAT